MKRALAVLSAFTLIFSLFSCGANTNEDDAVAKAVDTLKEHWKTEYKEAGADTDGYFEIKNTRVINIKENTTEEFKNVDYIVEFVLYTDYFGSAPYYQSAGTDDTVVVYTDGTAKVQSNLINQYRTKYFSNDFSVFLGSIEDLGDKYNCIEKLK